MRWCTSHAVTITENSINLTLIKMSFRIRHQMFNKNKSLYDCQNLPFNKAARTLNRHEMNRQTLPLPSTPCSKKILRIEWTPAH